MSPPADICLILEGSYPYVTGGVSTWTHDLIASQPELTFHILALGTPSSARTRRYELAGNVVGVTDWAVQGLPKGTSSGGFSRRLLAELEQPLLELLETGSLEAFGRILASLQPHRGKLGRIGLLNTRAAWAQLLRMYERSGGQHAFVDYFWSWRAMLGGLYSVLVPELPEARLYHALSTGYAGVVAARGVQERDCPALLTEHGIYTLERRTEIAVADWLHTTPDRSLKLAPGMANLKDLWIQLFVSYSRLTYAAVSETVTLFEGNREFQIADGASPEKLSVIPNGIDYDRYAALVPNTAPQRPTVALIGRVVPIKDTKTFILACANLQRQIPDLRAIVMGPYDEDPDYHAECRTLVAHWGLEETVEFSGRVRLEDKLPEVDVIVLTSISEAQPLVILEAGAAGIPCVATDVGACREMIEGKSDEDRQLGPGGSVVPLGDPVAVADALARILGDRDLRKACGAAMRERVRRYYNKHDLDAAYGQLYRRYLKRTDAVQMPASPVARRIAWPA